MACRTPQAACATRLPRPPPSLLKAILAVVGLPRTTADRFYTSGGWEAKVARERARHWKPNWRPALCQRLPTRPLLLALRCDLRDTLTSHKQTCLPPPWLTPDRASSRRYKAAPDLAAPNAARRWPATASTPPPRVARRPGTRTSPTRATSSSSPWGRSPPSVCRATPSPRPSRCNAHRRRWARRQCPKKQGRLRACGRLRGAAR